MGRAGEYIKNLGGEVELGYRICGFRGRCWGLYLLLGIVFVRLKAGGVFDILKEKREFSGGGGIELQDMFPLHLCEEYGQSYKVL